MDRHAPCFVSSRAHSFLEIAEDGLVLKYVGPARGDQDAAAALADVPEGHDGSDGFYFEVDVLSAGEDGFIGIGIGKSSVDRSRLPGWEPDSYGYHGDDGHSFSEHGIGVPYGPKYTTGDCVGSYFSKSKASVLWTLNGKFVGKPLPVKSSDLQGFRPSIGLRTRGEVVRANFGPSFRHKDAAIDQIEQLLANT